MASFEKERVAELFGLRVKDIFFSRHLEDTRSSRIRSGKNSVSFFIQTSWIKNIPYVHSHPRLAFLLGINYYYCYNYYYYYYSLFINYNIYIY